MLQRSHYQRVLHYLREFPAVALLGCRQVGKTTLALRLCEDYPKEVLYLDLERPSDRARLSESELFLQKQEGKLLILDEIHLVPELFPILRGIIDQRRRQGEKSGHFLILGSASPALLKQSSESLAGRIAYIELDPFSVTEVASSGILDYIDRVWVRGGFPDSFLASSEETSFVWRENFIQTYLSRDLPDLSPRLPRALIYRLWRMLALDQSTQLNLTKLAANLSISAPSVRHYIDVLSDLFLVRQLRPWHGNTRKRLVKTPKIYVRDSGLLHALTGIKDYNDLSAHPLYGASWEGFIVEQILQKISQGTEASFYRTSAGAEIDLILEAPHLLGTYAIEIKRSLTPKLSKGFQLACEDIQPHQCFYVIPTESSYPLNGQTQAIGIEALLTLLARNNL